MSNLFRGLLQKTAVAISATQVHVWRAHLEIGQAGLEQFQTSLSPDERIRSEAFRSPQDRQRFVAARGILRDILARYLNRTPSELRFGYGPKRKPLLKPDSELRFNLSHSNDLALYAVSFGREVGIDLERMEPHLATDEIAERLFVQQDVWRLRAMAAAQRTRAFFELWTSQEAYLKARGEGFTTHMNPPTAGSSPEETSGWQAHSLDAGPGYAATLVAQGTGWHPAFYEWQLRA